MTILYFAALRELVGCTRESAELPPEVVRVRDFSRWIQRRHPALAGRLKTVRFAIDERFADDDEPLHGANSVALLPPVSGG